MLGKYVDQINSRGVVLASGSIGRRNLCKLMGLEVETSVSGFAEDADWHDFSSPSDYALFNAREKISRVHSEKVVISADTVMALEGKVYEKPSNREEVIQWLKELMGRTHKAFTAVVVRGILTQEHIETTELTVESLSDEVIEAIANETHEWEGRAGGYSINGKLCCTIFSNINGCYYNVIGLPISSLSKMLVKEHEEFLASTNLS